MPENAASDILKGSSRIYELGYLLLPSLTEDELPKEISRLKEIFRKFGAEMVTEEPPKLIILAYSMFKVIANEKRKFTSAFFGWIKFQTEPGNLPKLKEELEISGKLIRFLIIKTVRESTLAPRRLIARGRPLRSKFETRLAEKEPAEKMDKEAVDRKIEELVLE